MNEIVIALLVIIAFEPAGRILRKLINFYDRQRAHSKWKASL